MEKRRKKNNKGHRDVKQYSTSDQGAKLEITRNMANRCVTIMSSLVGKSYLLEWGGMIGMCLPVLEHANMCMRFEQDARCQL